MLAFPVCEILYRMHSISLTAEICFQLKILMLSTLLERESIGTMKPGEGRKVRIEENNCICGHFHIIHKIEPFPIIKHFPNLTGK